MSNVDDKEIGKAVLMLRAEYKDMPQFDPMRLEMWARALGGFLAGSVTAAVERHLLTSKWPPQLADIVNLCRAQMDGQWLGADEAWALVPKHESESAMVTAEIAEALAAATPLLESGDKVAARMAFKDCYTRLVEKACIEGRQPRFFPSMGTDPLRRAEMLAKAVYSRQIGINEAIGYAPEHADAILSMSKATEHPLLAAPSEKGKAAVKALLADLKAVKK